MVKYETIKHERLDRKCGGTFILVVGCGVEGSFGEVGE